MAFKDAGEACQNGFGLMDSAGRKVLSGVSFNQMWKAIENNRSFVEMRVIQEWPGLSKEGRVIGDVHDIFEEEIRQMHRAVYAERG